MSETKSNIFQLKCHSRTVTWCEYPTTNQKVLICTATAHIKQVIAKPYYFTLKSKILGKQ